MGDAADEAMRLGSGVFAAATVVAIQDKSKAVVADSGAGLFVSAADDSALCLACVEAVQCERSLWFLGFHLKKP